VDDDPEEDVDEGDYQPDGREEGNGDDRGGDEEMFEEVDGEERRGYLSSSGLGGDGREGGRGGEMPEGPNEREGYEGDEEDEGDPEGGRGGEVDEEGQPLNYEVYDPEEDDDFPEYANEGNKKLNENIKIERRNNKQISLKIEDYKERLNVMKEHKKNIEQELKNTQALIDEKNLDMNTEKHLSQLAERQIGKISAELLKFDQVAVENQDRLNDIQQQIFKGNEQLDKLKLEINWNQEEMEQWALAAKQKEEDNLTMERYKRTDDVRIKELSLQLEKLTIEKNRREYELEKEITETQALQIEIDKTAEEFKKQHNERHRIYAQWDEAIHNIARRHAATLQITTENVTIQMQMKNNQDILNEKKKDLEREKQSNKKNEEGIKTIEREILELKNINQVLKSQEVDLNADLKINQNTLSADSSKLNERRNLVEMLQKELLGRKQRLTNAEKRYKAQVGILKSEENLEKYALEMEKEELGRYEEAKQRFEEMERDIKKKKEESFKAQNKLMKLRENEADLYSVIQGTMAALRNLQSHISKLHQELTRQQELLYNAEYQIQLLERKVSRANGEKTNKEAEILGEDTHKAQAKKQEAENEMNNLQKAIKNLTDEKRNLESNIKKMEGEKGKYTVLIEKLNLENDMTLLELNKIIKEKEHSMVQHDIMKLEIKKIQDRLRVAQDDVLQLENQKNQLELSLAEREKEVMVHKGVLVAEFKSAELDRHKIAVELADRKNKVKNLKIKFESLVQRKQGSESGNINEHSQAYYTIKAGQEKEELQRKEDELKAQIIKSKSDLLALSNTQSHLINRNSNYRDYFINRGATKKDVELKTSLEEQTGVAGENLMKKRKEFEKIKKEIEENTRAFNENQNKLEVLYNQREEAENQMGKLSNDVEKHLEKEQRAMKMLKKAQEELRKKGVTVDENAVTQTLLAKVEEQANLRKTLQSVVQYLST
jgi:hypothetical protein